MSEEEKIPADLPPSLPPNYVRITITILKSNAKPEVHIIPLEHGMVTLKKGLHGPGITNDVMYKLKKYKFAEQEMYLKDHPSVKRHFLFEVVLAPL